MAGHYRKNNTFDSRNTSTLAERVAYNRRNKNAIDLHFEINGKKYSGWANPSHELTRQGVPEWFEVWFWGEFFTVICYADDLFLATSTGDLEVIDEIEKFIIAWYQCNKLLAQKNKQDIRLQSRPLYKSPDLIASRITSNHPI